MRHEKGEKEVDINAKLLNAIAHPESRMFADVTTEKREQPSLIQRAIRLIQANNTSKALKIIKRGEGIKLVNVCDRLQEKLIQSSTQLPEVNLPEKNRSLFVMTSSQVSKTILHLKNGKTPSTGLMTSEHLKVLAYHQKDAPSAWSFLVTLINLIANGDLPHYLCSILLWDAMFPILKKDNSLRPVASCNTFVKVAGKLLMKHINVGKMVHRNQCYGKSFGPQIVSKKLQEALCSGSIVVKSDISNAFGNVDRGALARMLFDSSATKALWRYFSMRYSERTHFSVFTDTYQGHVSTNVGIAQGDAVSLLLFDFFVSDFEVSSAKEVYQIHDDFYMVTTPHDLQHVLVELQKYCDKKKLPLNVTKTQILARHVNEIPSQFHSMVCTSHTKVGGGFVHPCCLPLTATAVDDFNQLKFVKGLPFQHGMAVLKSAIIPSWNYANEATSPEIFAPVVEKIKIWQKAFIRDILHSTNNDIVQPNDEQLFAPLQDGGVGLFSPCQHAWRNLGQFKKQQDSSHDWQCSLSKSVCESLKTKYPILGVQPLHQHLLIDDHAFSSFLALLLGTCTPQRWSAVWMEQLLTSQKRRLERGVTQNTFSCVQAVLAV